MFIELSPNNYHSLRCISVNDEIIKFEYYQHSHNANSIFGERIISNIYDSISKQFSQETLTSNDTTDSTTSHNSHSCTSQMREYPTYRPPKPKIVIDEIEQLNDRCVKKISKTTS